MVDLYEGPSREGTRGGLEQFTWESVRGQVFKDRECYLGQSVRVGVQGKFGRFLTNDWWLRKREDPQQLREEQEIVKRFEEELMQEALGVKPKRLLLIKGELSDEQKRELMLGLQGGASSAEAGASSSGGGATESRRKKRHKSDKQQNNKKGHEKSRDDHNAPFMPRDPAHLARQCVSSGKRTSRESSEQRDLGAACTQAHHDSRRYRRRPCSTERHERHGRSRSGLRRSRRTQRSSTPPHRHSRDRTEKCSRELHVHNRR